MHARFLGVAACVVLFLLASAMLAVTGIVPVASPTGAAGSTVLRGLASGNATSTGSGSLNVLTAFLAVGGIIAVGFAAGLIFERTRVPDLLILIFLGLVLGPVSATLFGIPLVPLAVLQYVTPYFTTVALMIILFDGGLNLQFTEIAKFLGVAGLQTGLAFVASVIVTAFVTVAVLGYPWPVGLMLGAILGGTSSAVVIGVVRPLRASPEVKVILTLESVLTDVLCVVTVLALIQLLQGGPGASMVSVFSSLGQSFLVGIGVGLAFGFGWLILLRRLEGKPFSYMLTVAILFVVYASGALAGGSGAMAAFTFGLVLGNHRTIERRFSLKSRSVVDERIRQFHGEIVFVVRTFFFVFLGVVFTFEFTGTWAVSTPVPLLDRLNGTFWLFLAGILVVFLGIVAVRFGVARITARVHHKSPTQRRLLWSVMGRGLAAAVLASLPFTISAFLAPSTPGETYYASVLAPYETQFLNAAFFIILLTVMATTLGVVSSERALGRAAEVTRQPFYSPTVLELFKDLRIDDLEVNETPPPASAPSNDPVDRRHR
jgi:cell volume regulation protein A